MPTAFVRRPGPRLDDGLVTDRAREPIDAAAALHQWQAYVAAFVEAGWQIVEVDPADDHPDAVFVEDAVVLFGDLAVVTRPGATERRDEIVGAEAAMRRAGFEVAHIEAPGELDGGDVLKVGSMVYVGRSARTNTAAIEQLAALLEPRGLQVRPVPVTRVLHLKSAVTALPDGTVIGHDRFVDDPELFDRYRPVPEPAGAHVVVLGPDERNRQRLLIAAGAPRTARQLRADGYDVVDVDIGEFEKLDGCVTCLSVRDRR